MYKPWFTGIILGSAIAIAASAIGGYRLLGPSAPQFAEVLEIQEITREVPAVKEVCSDVQVTHRKQPRDENQLLGTVAGAVIGGVAGNQIGGGSGQKIATAAGAIAGGVAGKKTQEKMQSSSTYTTTERRCETLEETRTEVIGYDVRYRLDNQEGRVRMDNKPDGRIPVHNGELVLASKPVGADPK